MTLVVVRGKSSTIHAQVYIIADRAFVSVASDIRCATFATFTRTERAITACIVDRGPCREIRQSLVICFEAIIWMSLASAQYTFRAKVPVWTVQASVLYTSGSL